jgi:hypothetical protein
MQVQSVIFRTAVLDHSVGGCRRDCFNLNVKQRALLAFCLTSNPTLDGVFLARLYVHLLIKIINMVTVYLVIWRVSW